MSVDTLTDSELRSKLAEYGYPVGPVTQTTRKILIKKLKNLMESRGASGSRHSLAARYSSDDTDDDSASTNRKKKVTSTNRRQTMANPMPPPAPAAPMSTGISRSPSKKRIVARVPDSKAAEDDNQPKTNSAAVVKTVHKKVTTTYKVSSASDGLETGSDSDMADEPEKNYFTSERDRSADVEVKKTYHTPSDRSSKILRPDSHVVPPFVSDISPIPSIKEDTSFKRDDLNDLLANYESPYLSEFTRRLSSQTKEHSVPRSTAKSSFMRSGRADTKEIDTNGHFSNFRSTYNSPTTTRYATSTSDRPRETVTRAFKSNATNKEESKNTQNVISMVLVIVLALFFGILAIVYLGLGGKNDFIPATPMDSAVPICSQTDHDKPGVNCLLNENVETVMQLLKKLRPILMKKAVTAACEDNNEVAYLTDSEIINMLKSNKVKEIEVTEDLHNAQLLIVENPKWGISLIEVGESDVSQSILDSMEKIFRTRVEGKVAMVMLNPELPVKCLIKQKVSTVLSSLLITAIGLLIMFSGHRLVQWYLKSRKSAEREVFQLVSEIISMVELHHQNAATTSIGGTQESYLAINHVRDNLIPPKNRKKMASLWEKAVKFLDENESRIRREVQQVSGEEFHVWRWLPNVNTSLTSSPVGNKKSKVWQGQAFETMEGSVNSLAYSPTNCLKIRHMFDPDAEIEEDWETKVQDAILEKCGEKVKILHIQVDRGSREGCVYVKCMSQEDAGKAYKALHGWWFDGNLVTVKYLRKERYHERFPDSLRCTSPLKPSNNQRLSMQANCWQSSLEAI